MSLDPVNEQVVEGEAAQSIDSEQGPDLSRAAPDKD